MFRKPSIIAMVPARWASTRFPGKPLAMIGGKTLVQRVVENARRYKDFKDVIVLTDDARISEHVLGFGGKVLMTSSSCQTGTDRLVEASIAFPELQEHDIIVNVQGDEPLLDPKVIRDAVDLLLEDDEAVVSTAAVPIRNYEEAISPNVAKVVLDLKGNALYFSRSLIPFNRRGSFDATFPHYYRHIGLYCFRAEFLPQMASLSPTPLQMYEDLEQLRILEHGFRMRVAILSDSAMSIEVNFPEDVARVEEALSK